jgi:hypothetical protein
LRRNNNRGYVDSLDEDLNTSTPETIVFANRNVITYSNSLSGKYSISSKMNFNVAVSTGRLANLDNYNINKDSSFYSGILTFLFLVVRSRKSSFCLYRNNAEF